jgi:hypothetical protein
VAFFPIIDLSVPENCYEEAACGAPGYCQFINVCPSSGTICLDQSDCVAAGFPNDPCAYYGQCAMGGGASACMPDAGVNCPPGAGPCVPIGFCENRFTCDPEPYGPPVFGIELLPAAADEFVQTINKQIPEGGTPTLPALTGVIEHAAAWSAANPTHNVIVVLATDGQPSVCDPDLLGDPEQAIANLAAVADSGNQAGIQTWVIGVFSPATQAQAQLNLDAIAEAGGTEKAFVIATDDVVTSEFLAALNQVRLTAKSCEFELSLGEDVDHDAVWVKITPKGADPIWVKRVPSADACVEGGFFYDDPFTPTKIVLCPETCAVLGASPDRTLEIFTTCPDPTGDG